MSPLPYVRGQVVVLAILLATSAVLGASVVALSCAATASASIFALGTKYRHDLTVMGASTPPHRARLDAVVSGDAWAALAPASLLTALSFAFPVDPSTAGTARIAVGYLTIAATAVYISSLVDWYVILPRIGGQLGARPCRDDDPGFPYPHSWKEVTRWWYIHRIVATLVFRFLVAWALAAVIGKFVGAGEGAKFLAGLVMGIFATYLSTVSAAVFEAAQPKLLVGQTVNVKARPRRQRWPPFTKIHPPDLRGRQHVVDVSLEGVHLTGAATREHNPLPSPRFVRDADRLALANLDSAKLAPRQFSGCTGRCSGINWYCIENPRCFQAK
jgi:hypothetical protein